MRKTILSFTIVFLLLVALSPVYKTDASTKPINVEFELSFPEPEQQIYHVEMKISGFKEETKVLHIPRRMPD